MFRRRFELTTGVTRCAVTVVVTVLSILISATGTFAQGQSPISVSLDYLDPVCQQETVNVSVRLNQDSAISSIGGFNLLIGYDSLRFRLLGVSQGPLLGSCGWEYFTFQKFANPVACDSCPLGLIRLTAAADIENGNSHPSCLLEGMSGVLGTLTFKVKMGADCMGDLPLRFYWGSCTDNVFSTATGDTIFVSQGVYDHGNPAPRPLATTLPSLDGAPDSCLSLSPDPPVRLIDFVNGGFYVLCCEPTDWRGDLNVNGLNYELADLIVFVNYFLFGLDSFLPDPLRQVQIAASDVNADGLVLTFRDLIYLYRVVVGDALPISEWEYSIQTPDSLTADFVQNITTNTMSVAYSGFLSGVYLSFQGTIFPTLLWPDSGEIYVSYDSAVTPTTAVVIMPGGKQAYVSGDFLHYTGSGILQYVETADWFDTPIRGTISLINVPGACGDFDASGICNIGDVVYLIAYIFAGGSAPTDSHLGDVNCDQICNISDAVKLVRYIFVSGTPPCADCP